MDGQGEATVPGIGTLTYQRAVDIARNTEGDLDPAVNNYLEQAMDAIWQRVISDPDNYVFTRDEFAVFNCFHERFEGQVIAQQAVYRYWRSQE